LSVQKNIFFSLTVFLILLGALEISARIFQFSRGRNIQDSIFTPVYRHYYFLGPAFKPSSEVDWDSTQSMKINSYGFRGNEMTIEKPPNTFRILTFGGSTSHSSNYPEKLSDLLQADNNKIRYGNVEIINAAVPGWNTTQSLIQFITRGLYLNPDMIIIYHAINNNSMSDNYWLHSLKEVEYTRYGGFLRNHSQLYAFLYNRWDRLKRSIKQTMWNRQIQSNVLPEQKKDESHFSTQVFKKDIEHFIILAGHYGIKVMLVTMPLNYQSQAPNEEKILRAGYFYKDFENKVARVQQLNDALKTLAEKHHVYVADIANTLFSQDPENFDDLCHFSKKGAERFAEMIKEHVESIIMKT